jgi:hypothetical protein
MAGNYPDAPSWRMAYDRDGTQVFKIDGANNITQLTSTQVNTLNDESDGSFSMVGTSATASLLFIFPELRDLDGFLNVGQSSFAMGSVTVSVSANTTNGIDGTWSTISTAAPVTGGVKATYRTSIVSSTALAIKAVKFRGSSGSSSMWDAVAVHLYGEPVPGANPNRLELWHPTLDEKLPPAYFDWGDVPRSSSSDRAFRVKNLSAAMTAGAVRVAMESLTDTVPSVPAQHTISYGGGSFLAQVNIGDLAPGAISGPLTLRRITPSNAVLSLWSFRVFAESTAWA